MPFGALRVTGASLGHESVAPYHVCTMWKELIRFLFQPVFPSERVRIEERGFCIVRRRAAESAVRWDDVEEVEAICTNAALPSPGIPWIRFRLSEGSELMVWPEARGYHQFANQLSKHLDGVPENWYHEVMEDCRSVGDCARVLYRHRGD